MRYTQETQLFLGRVLPIFFLFTFLFACQSTQTRRQAAGPATILAGSRWQLQHYLSDDGEVHSVPEGQIYRVDFGADDRISFQLNCNLANGTWQSSVETNDGPSDTSGSLQLGPLGSTRAFCAPPSLDQQFLQAARYIVSYRIAGALLYLDWNNPEGSSGSYVWQSQGAN